MNDFFWQWHDGLKKESSLLILFVYYFRIFIVVIVLTYDSEYSIVAIIQVMSGTLDISAGLKDLM